MKILTIRTDNPEAEIGLYDNDKQLAYEIWQAHRQLAETIHQQITTMLQSMGADWDNIQGIVVFQGPGSFTGLRIGISTANALAYGLEVPLVAEQDEDWIRAGISRLQTGALDKQAVPEYGSPVHITTPKK